MRAPTELLYLIGISEQMIVNLLRCLATVLLHQVVSDVLLADP
jgi:hypothetical protein